MTIGKVTGVDISVTVLH